MSDALFQRVHVSALHVDPVVQRALDAHRAQKIADQFNPNAAGALIVNLRSDDGKYFIIDGQHRHAAAILSGYDGKLNCVVHQGLSQASEAALFLSLNDSKLVQAIDKFRMRVLANDTAATQINGIIEDLGWKVVQQSGVGCFAAISAMEKVYNGAGVRTDGPYPPLVRAVMHTITAAWGHGYAGGHSAIVGGLGQLFARYADGVDVDKLTAEMAKTRPVDLVTKAKGIKDSQGGTVPAAMAKVLVGLHNKSRRTNKLPDWSWTR